MTGAAGLAPRSVRAPRLARPGRESRHARLDLEPDPACVAGARRLARGLLGRLGWDPDRVDDAVLVVSELVGNAVVHAAPGHDERPAIILTLYGNPAELSVMAWDNGSCDGLPDSPGTAADDAESGRGLGITASLSGGEWGWWETPHCGGKVVWAYLGKKGTSMNQQLCTCGYQADDAEDLAVHFGEMFIPVDDTAPDGQVHCEVASNSGTPGPPTLTCRCGFVGTVSDFDGHLLGVFAPDDRVGLDGKRHDQATAADTPAQ